MNEVKYVMTQTQLNRFKMLSLLIAGKIITAAAEKDPDFSER